MRGKVVEVEQSSIKLDDGTAIAYDYLVLSIGSTATSPFSKASGAPTIQSRLASYDQLSQEYSKSKSVLIVGGGPVGVELAAELAHANDGSKKISLLHSHGRLLSALRPEAGAKAKEVLEAYHVDVILNDRLPKDAEATGGVYKSQTGREITADLVYWCIGIHLNTEFLKGSFLSDSLKKTGELTVDDFLRVPSGDGRVFAIGDCAATGEIKLGYLAKKHAKSLVKYFKKVRLCSCSVHMLSLNLYIIILLSPLLLSFFPVYSFALA